ncbi:lipoprotein insertase outer membrane protein LolB [Enterovibrio sp. ZSDZ35]|uniref:Outer-membrane lipoprotein LolB n=1 Tax=Enterovibrio qingdaonensis TaxID=2899818 RepID=A0ABT5QKH7_9GAMM|nr:lipoprotein insertase outer membrane protein LolB [Enterovibrio sp. ZSDZ35]MDD1781487.1 lipoprotein insertase outer membrane protein LolB [Enterovibrio sp. ZSDZ35]
MYRQLRLIIGLLLSFLSLSGCTTTPPVPLTQWETHQTALSDIQNFTVKGKVALISPEQRVSANFVWQQQGDNLSLRLTNFLGATLLKLDATPHRAELTDNDGKRYVGGNAANLLKSLTGIALPVDDMMFWIKGLPAAGNEYQLGADNRLASLSENPIGSNKPGWQLDYLSYDSNTASLLPAKIKMFKNDQKVNLVISQWTYK